MAIIKNGVTRYMSINGRNSVAVRDEHGRWLKGFSGGPGWPIGSRNKLTEDFLGDVHAAWLKHGARCSTAWLPNSPRCFSPSSRERSMYGASSLASLGSSIGRAIAARC